MIGWIMLLFAAGMALILAEFVVPGLICGILGSLLVLASGFLACRTYSGHVLFIVLVYSLGICGCVATGMYMMARTRAAKHLILGDSQQMAAGWVAADSDMSLVGMQGKAITTLRPAGTILVDGKRLDAVTNGGYIEKDADIRVIEVHGSRIVVEKAE